jgi:hypothetical protein
MCPHATTTTVAFLYGEGGDAHAAHVAACPDCAAVVEEHAAVAVALAPKLAALRVAPARRRSWVPAAAVALAASALLVAGVAAWRSWPAPAPAPVLAELPSVPVDDGVDRKLDDLDQDVTSLELEML